MSIGGANDVSRGAEASVSPPSNAAGSDLANAGADRVEAAQRAIDTGALNVTPDTQIGDFAQATPTQGQAGTVSQGQGLPPGGLAQASSTLPPEPTTLELAQMSQAVYGEVGPPRGWAVASAQQLAEIGLTPDMLTSPTSEFQAQVYVREIAGQTSYTVSFRGTQSRNDWVANGQQGLGFQTDHYNRALEIGESLIVPEGSRVTLTGHSLGGGLASTAAIASELDATTFNAAGLHRNTIGAAHDIAAADGQLEIPDISAVYVRGDILSMVQDGGDQMIGGLIGRGLGSWLGGPLGGAAGGLAGRQLVDAPEAYGNRMEIDPVRPEGMRWYQDNPVARHSMNYVISSLQGN